MRPILPPISSAPVARRAGPATDGDAGASNGLGARLPAAAPHRTPFASGPQALMRRPDGTEPASGLTGASSGQAQRALFRAPVRPDQGTPARASTSAALPAIPASATIAALSDAGSGAFELSGTFTETPRGLRGSRQVSIVHEPPTHDAGYAPGHLRGGLVIEETPLGTVSTFKVQVIRAATEQDASGKRMLLAAHRTARQAVAADLAGRASTQGIRAPAVPDVVRLAHLQNHGVNDILFRHYEALKALSAMPQAPTLADYKRAYHAVAPPRPGARQHADSYMEAVRKNAAEQLQGLPPHNQALDYANLDIAFPSHINPQAESHPLSTEVNTFLHGKLTALDGASLTTTVARFVHAASGANTVIAGLYFNADQDTVDLHTAPEGRQPQLKVYQDESMYSDAVYQQASARGV